VQPGAFDVLKNIYKLYLVLPHEPGDAAAEMAKDGQCLSAELADCIAWWFDSYAKCVREYTEE
jgi:hypothetical protein